VWEAAYVYERLQASSSGPALVEVSMNQEPLSGTFVSRCLNGYRLRVRLYGNGSVAVSGQDPMSTASVDTAILLQPEISLRGLQSSVYVSINEDAPRWLSGLPSSLLVTSHAINAVLPYTVGDVTPRHAGDEVATSIVAAVGPYDPVKFADGVDLQLWSQSLGGVIDQVEAAMSNATPAAVQCWLNPSRSNCSISWQLGRQLMFDSRAAGALFYGFEQGARHVLHLSALQGGAVIPL